MADILTSFGTIAGTIFLAELVDKDAFLLITVSTKMRAHLAFLAGATAFVMTTTLFVTLGTVLVAFVPVYWVRLAGGGVMLGYGLWEARSLVGLSEVEREKAKVERSGSSWKAFLALVGALALLDIAGDATEVLTIVFVARYEEPLLVFLGACAGLICADALETTLGSRLGKILTPERLRYFSVVVFLALGASIIVLSP
jgi:Ca2+/H+ antiporter, TMEM165/GDT1 family